MHQTKKAGPKFMPVKYFKSTAPLHTHINTSGTVIVFNGSEVSESAVEALKKRYISTSPLTVHDYHGANKGQFAYFIAYNAIKSSLAEVTSNTPPYLLKIPEPVECHIVPAPQAAMPMREIPKMSIEQSHAISRRMFARTAEERAEELYDDAE
ncbi:hypothetical protein JNA99_07580 [Klebsiella oxytoca]|uniref:hypothetical protein n=1 Tax=Klebsiella oxytoca TaxID=571 RepID=UPI00066CD700|nr:hypothetical protein [Klebsiella oxytoca]KMV90591.1 hypothetical protein HMPREF9688_03390 [Klebsiella oxytoca 10-5244]MBL5997491.1 hypothetical protein [Klebsiella oxytoca]MBL6213352.1 hypothetical protein [Klebsiella oxytoca]UHC78659.1 hypothetical protein LUW97_12820 [Klebsiella oxytoca]UHC95737.1 hypothetical protein LUW98_12820 [Klebsiella oxytoca]